MINPEYLPTIVILLGLAGVNCFSVGDDQKCSEIKGMNATFDANKFARQWIPYATLTEAGWDTGCTYLNFGEPTTDGTFDFMHLDLSTFDVWTGAGSVKKNGYRLDFPSPFEDHSTEFRVVETDYDNFALVASCDENDDITNGWVYSKYFGEDFNDLSPLDAKLKKAGFLATAEFIQQKLYVVDHDCQAKLDKALNGKDSDIDADAIVG